MERGLVPWSWAGLEAQPLLKDSTNTSGILVPAFLPASPAAASGLRPGDIITAWNGQPLQACRAEDVPCSIAWCSRRHVGTEVAVRGLRTGRTADLAPDDAGARTQPGPRVRNEILGR